MSLDKEMKMREGEDGWCVVQVGRYGIEEGAGLDFREDHKADGGRSKAGRQSGAMP